MLYHKIILASKFSLLLLETTIDMFYCQTLLEKKQFRFLKSLVAKGGYFQNTPPLRSKICQNTPLYPLSFANSGQQCIK